jgi:hypothetical protein
LIVEITVARGELIAEEVEESEVDFVGAMRIRGMHLRLDLSGIVEQQIEDVMAFMFVRAMMWALIGI